MDTVYKQISIKKKWHLQKRNKNNKADFFFLTQNGTILSQDDVTVAF